MDFAFVDLKKHLTMFPECWAMHKLGIDECIICAVQAICTAMSSQKFELVVAIVKI